MNSTKYNANLEQWLNNVRVQAFLKSVGAVVRITETPYDLGYYAAILEFNSESLLATLLGGIGEYENVDDTDNSVVEIHQANDGSFTSRKHDKLVMPVRDCVYSGPRDDGFVFMVFKYAVRKEAYLCSDSFGLRTDPTKARTLVVALSSNDRT